MQDLSRFARSWTISKFKWRRKKKVSRKNAPSGSKKGPTTPTQMDAITTTAEKETEAERGTETATETGTEIGIGTGIETGGTTFSSMSYVIGVTECTRFDDKISLQRLLLLLRNIIIILTV